MKDLPEAVAIEQAPSTFLHGAFSTVFQRGRARSARKTNSYDDDNARFFTVYSRPPRVACIPVVNISRAA